MDIRTDQLVLVVFVFSTVGGVLGIAIGLTIYKIWESRNTYGTILYRFRRWLYLRKLRNYGSKETPYTPTDDGRTTRMEPEEREGFRESSPYLYSVWATGKLLTAPKPKTDDLRSPQTDD